MKERPILFSGPMVHALLGGRKTQTRRAMKGVPPDAEGPFEPAMAPGGGFVLNRWAMKWGGKMHPLRCPYGGRGDRLWVRETWRECATGGAWYRATPLSRDDPGPWRPSIFMPRFFSRFTLDLTGVRVERLQDISEEDAKAEGVEARTVQETWTAYDPKTDGYPCFFSPPDPGKYENVRHHPARLLSNAKEEFRGLWTSINGEGSWDSNPWVWALSFKQVSP